MEVKNIAINALREIMELADSKMARSIAMQALNDIGHLTNNLCPICDRPMGNPIMCIWCSDSAMSVGSPGDDL